MENSHQGNKLSNPTEWKQWTLNDDDDDDDDDDDGDDGDDDDDDDDDGWWMMNNFIAKPAAHQCELIAIRSDVTDLGQDCVECSSTGVWLVAYIPK